VDALSGADLDAYLSIKAPGLGFDRGALSEILERARSAGIGVHFDSLAPESAGRTLSLAGEAAKRHPDVGFTVPARWRRSPADARAASEAGLSVRVVKGQWADAGASRAAVEPAFMAIVGELAGGHRRVAVATHDEPLARKALRELGAAGTRSELELLFGLPAAGAARTGDELSVPVRFYVPYGHPTLPYRVADARRDLRVLGWLSQDLWWGRRKGWRELARQGPRG
jgi:proline dehydrogenase